MRSPRTEDKARIAEWIEDARRELPPGSTLYTTVKHVARSGMSRSIDVHTIDCTGDDPSPRWWSYRIAAILGESYDDDRECVRVGGAGMDMGFHLIYSLSSTLYPHGHGCTGERCPSNDHSNGSRDYHKHTAAPRLAKRARELGRTEPGPLGAGYYNWHRDGGYALRQAWM